MLTQAQIAAAHAPRCTGPFVTVKAPGHGRWTVRAYAREAFEALAQTMAAFGYSTREHDTGAGVCRKKVSGSGWSIHAYWIAADSNWGSNPYGTRRTDRPAGLNHAITRIRTRNGRQVFNNGIFWRSGPDPMHDEIVCRPQDLAHGIDWSTVPGGRRGTRRPAKPAPKPQPQPQPKPEPPEEDDDDMALYVRRAHINHPTQRGAVWRFSGNTCTQIEKDSLDFDMFLAAASGRPIKVVDANEAQFHAIARGRMDTRTGKPIVL